MARRKKTPETSRITRAGTIAYARKQKPDGTDEPPESAKAPAAADDAGPDSKFDVTDRSQPVPVAEVEKRAAQLEPPAPPAASPVPAPAEDPPSAPAEAPAAPTAVATRREQPTAMMPMLAPVGRPPEMPEAPIPAGVSPSADAVEDPTSMPGPNEIPAGSPSDPTPAPGRVPPGDSRSLRRRDATTYEFALIYRRGTYVITRFGTVGTRGQWRVVEYPTSASASHAYAKECSRFVSDGFSDYRE